MEDGIEHNDKRLSGKESMGSIVVEDIKSKNLFDKNDCVDHYYLDYNSGQPVYDTNMAYMNSYIPVKANEKYTMSYSSSTIFVVYEYDSNKTFLRNKRQNTDATSFTVTISEDTSFIRLACGFNFKSGIQFEKGPVATSYTNHINFDYDKNRGNCTLLFNNQVGTGNTYDLSDTLQNYRYIIFMLLLNGNAISLIYPYEALHISGYVGRVELRCYESASSLTEIIMDLEFLNDTQVICDRCGYIEHNSTEFGHNPYGLRIYGIK